MRNLQKIWSQPAERITGARRDAIQTIPLSLSNHFSNYWEIDKLNNTLATIDWVVLKLKSHFARYGCPDQVISDNGPQFDSEVFRTFSRTWEFEYLTSSPFNPRANRKDESAVNTAKSLLRKGTAIQEALDSGRDP